MTATTCPSSAAVDDSADDILRQLTVGVTRVRDVDGFVGTVLYVGPVPSAKNASEIYAGIAWDDASRGKHDGSVICRTTNRLVRLFHCQGGSFLRLSKLDLGVTLDPALMQSKYVGLDAPRVAPNNVLPHVARTAGGRDKPIEFLGEMKIRTHQQLEDLDKISLRSLGIARACTDQGMVEFQHLKDIDLAGNLLSHWDTVFAILGQFPLLENISLASNRILDIPPHMVESPVNLDRVRVLNLNGCSIKSFRTVQWIADSMPQLEELCVAYNDLSDVQNVCGFDNLSLLDCSSCNLTCWKSQVQCFGKLPALQHFMLNNNALSDISMGTVNPDCFPTLCSLQLAGTNIDSWQDLDGLRSLSKLQSLRFRNTPLTASMGAGEARALAIARIPNLSHLNASPISSKERLEAERRYVSTVARELLLVSSSPSDHDNGQKLQEQAGRNRVLALHPLFEELAERHKDSMLASSSIGGGAGPGGRAGGAHHQPVNVVIRSMAADSCSMEALQKRLPGGLKVGRVKAMCMRAFGLETERQLLHTRREGDPFPTELDDDDHTLSYYGICDGDEIIMNEVDLEARQREHERIKEEHGHRVAEQERDARALQELQKSDAKARSAAALLHSIHTASNKGQVEIAATRIKHTLDHALPMKFERLQLDRLVTLLYGRPPVKPWLHLGNTLIFKLYAYKHI